MTPTSRAKLGLRLVQAKVAAEDAREAREARERLDRRLDTLDLDAGPAAAEKRDHQQHQSGHDGDDPRHDVAEDQEDDSRDDQEDSPDPLKTRRRAQGFHGESVSAEQGRFKNALDVLPYHLLTRSRCASKTTDLAGLALALLLATEHPARFVWTAADADQGRLALDRINAFLRDSNLAAEVEVQTRRVRIPATDPRLDLLPADEASSWGLLVDAAFVDELTNRFEARRSCRSATARPTARLPPRLLQGTEGTGLRRRGRHSIRTICTAGPLIRRDRGGVRCQGRGKRRRGRLRPA